MQRKIAFRAWDKTRKQMNYKVLVGNTDPNDENYTCNQLLVDGEWMNADESCIDLMQFTGQQDSSGKDIWEGDIIEFDLNEWGGKDNIHVVSWGDEYAEWDWGGGTTDDMEWWTVIGNIYENPELISKLPKNP